MSRFDYYRPTSLEEAWRRKARTSNSRFVAGGTDLLVHIRDRRATPTALISLRGLPELAGIERGRIGATVLLADLIAHPEVDPVLVQAARLVGSVQIRNQATLGGNLCNASPAADLAPPLLVLGARVELCSPAGTREVPLEQFFLGPGQTCLGPEEILTAVLLERPGARAVFLRQSRVAMDVAQVSLCLGAVREDGVCRRVRVAAGAVAPVPLRLPEVEALIEGRTISPALLDQVQSAAARSVAPISDLRASADYRRHLVGVLARRALERIP